MLRDKLFAARVGDKSPGVKKDYAEIDLMFYSAVREGPKANSSESRDEG